MRKERKYPKDKINKIIEDAEKDTTKHVLSVIFKIAISALIVLALLAIAGIFGCNNSSEEVKPKKGFIHSNCTKYAFKDIPTRSIFLIEGSEETHYKLNENFYVACLIESGNVIGNGTAASMDPEEVVCLIGPKRTEYKKTGDLCFKDIESGSVFKTEGSDELFYKLNEEYYVACKIEDGDVIGNGTADSMDPQRPVTLMDY